MKRCHDTLGISIQDFFEEIKIETKKYKAAKAKKLMEAARL
jgi:hypothetical protein